MKKILILLLLLLVACGGSSEETAVNDTTTTTVQDTTTTTIPPVPTIGFDIIENYNLKLVDELCLGSESIDTVTESCLKQYREDLEWLTRYNDQIQEYVNELNQYFEQYPEQLTEEYSSYLSFVENEYRAVFTDYEIVSDKYIERFGGVPSLLSISYDDENLKNWCPAEFSFEYTENFKSGVVTYINSLEELISINIASKVEVDLNVTGGEFRFHKAEFENYLGETFVIEEDNINTQFVVKNFGPMITGIKFIEATRSLEVTFNPGEAEVKTVIVFFERKSLENNWSTALETNPNVGGTSSYTKLFKDKAIIGLLNDTPKAPEPITLYAIFVSFSEDGVNSTQFFNTGSIKGYSTIKNCGKDKNNFDKINFSDTEKIFQYQNSAFQQFLNAELIIND